MTAASPAAQPRIRLTPLAERHLDATLTWANDAELMRLMDRVTPVEPDGHRRWFEGLRNREDCRYFAAETIDGDHHVGNVWLWNIDPRHRRAEIRVVMGDVTARDRGLGSEAIDLLATWAFQALGLHRVYAYVLAINPRAQRAFEKAGFRAEGLLRGDRWSGDMPVDVYLLARLASDTRP